MAELAVNRMSDYIVSVVEDPVLTNNRIFINGQSYNTTTMSPNWMETWHFNYGDKWQVPLWRDNSTAWQATNSAANPGTQFTPMLLEKGTIQCYGNADGSYMGGIWADTYWRSLDPANYPARRTWRTAQGNVIMSFPEVQSNTPYEHVIYFKGNDITAVNGWYYNEQSSSGTTYMASQFLYEDVINNRIYGVSRYLAGFTSETLQTWQTYDTNGRSGGVQPLSITTGGSLLFMGVDSAGWTWWMQNDDSTASSPYTIRKVDPRSLSVTSVLSASHRYSTAAYRQSRPSNIRRTSDTRRVFYSSHFDNLGQLSPIRYIWDSAASTAVATNTIVTYNSSDTYSSHATAFTLAGQTTNANGWNIKGHQFSNAGIDYITYFVSDMTATTGANGAARWDIPAKRTAITYTMGANVAVTLTGATISGTTLSFTSSTGALCPGMVLTGGAITAGTYLIQHSGSNNLSWTVSASQTLASTTLTATPTVATLTSATISGNTLTFVSSTGSSIAVGMTITGTGVTADTFIVSGSGTTWSLNKSQTVASTTMTAFKGAAVFTATIAPAAIVATLTTGAITGNVLTFASAAGATVVVGMVISGGTTIAGTYIVSGSGLSWIVSISQTAVPTTATAITMTANTPTVGTIAVGMLLNGGNIVQNTVVTGVGTGIGGAGTYYVTPTQSLGNFTATGILYTDERLHFHSKMVYTAFTDLPRNWLPINATGTQLAVPTNAGQLSFYNFNPTLGWVSTGPYAIDFRQIGLDQSNRLWGTSAEKGYNVVHLITPTMPISINITMADSSYTYSGSNVSTTALVNAYGSTGTRIVSTVTLTIDGASMIFTSTGTKTVSVTTSDSASTSVAVTITGGGVNNIVASVSI